MLLLYGRNTKNPSRSSLGFMTNLADVSDDSDTELPDVWRKKQSTFRQPERHKNFGIKRGKQKHSRETHSVYAIICVYDTGKIDSSD